MSETHNRFSRRTGWDLAASELSLAISRARASGRVIIDLTVSNPTLCGFDYNAEALLAPLADPASLTYDPDPRGMRSAREAVAAYYAHHAAFVDHDSLVLTTSTSEAYSYLFRLLCDPGDEVLVAQPSYPLFEFLANLDDVHLRPYPLFYDFGWWIDFSELERRIGPRTRAILIVHPNNPTGHWTHQNDRGRLEELCLSHGLALIVDEVFLDYPIDRGAGSSDSEPPPAASFATGPQPVLAFVLSGISKIAALPQMKVAWVAVLGPKAAVDGALARLEVIADTFLSMNAPAQLALPSWLAGRGHLQRQIRMRVAANLAELTQSGLEVLKVEAGWSAIVKLRDVRAEIVSLAEMLLDRAGVIVHPGSFYGLTDSRLIVVSLLTPIALFQAAARRLSEFRDGCRNIDELRHPGTLQEGI